MSATGHRDYSGTPLERKLGLVTAKGGIGEVALLGAPDGFRALLGELPASVKLREELGPETKLALCFVRSRKELLALLEMLTMRLAPGAHVWIVHPKAHHSPDMNQNDLRDAALAAGLLDYKVSSVDPDWSGLKFCWRER